jgi:UDP-N-acetylmuramyl-tripeptide synthetase
VGAHNLENILCAAGVGLALNLSADDLKSGLNAVTTIPGRLERIENDNGRFVYVDYAHTPDALENVIGALRAVTADRIICVFGCGGDRDSEKRPLMGEIAARLCDLAVITSDNPRTEEPMAIINQILEGTRKINSVRYSQADLQGGFNEKGYTVEADRQRAIRLGISVSRSGDTVLIAGKGHETYQILGRTTIDFDDREEARKALRAVRG